MKYYYVAIKLVSSSIKIARFLVRIWPWFSVDRPMSGALGEFPQTPQYPPTHPVWAGWLC